jgi:hypothetical protein
MALIELRHSGDRTLVGALAVNTVNQAQDRPANFNGITKGSPLCVVSMSRNN